MDLKIDLSKTTAKNFGIELKNGKSGRYKIGYDVEKGKFYSDRTRAGIKDFSDNFAVKRHSAKRLIKIIS